MTTATKEIARLDRFLRTYGSGTATLTRVVGTTHQSRFSVTLRYHSRQYEPDELSELIIQGDSHVIISPTRINESGWPGAQPVGPITKYDVRVPRRGDKITYKGKERNIEFSDPFDFDDILIRLELQCRG